MPRRAKERRLKNGSLVYPDQIGYYPKRSGKAYGECRLGSEAELPSLSLRVP